jgi:hypothetical protein
MNTHKLLLTFFFTVILSLGCFDSARAQQLTPKPASITITPATIDTKVKRGASYTQNFTIINSTGVRLRFRSSINDIWIDEQNNRLDGRPGTLPRSASLWLQFSPTEIIVEPQSSGIVKAVITVPQDVSGSFYTVPVFEGMPAEKSPTQKGVSTATIGIRFRALVMLTTDEGSEYNVEVMDGKIPPTASTEMELNLDLRNRGSAHARVRGAFAILNSAGALAGRGSIDAKRFLPTQRNFIKSKWAGELPTGKYTCIVTLSYDRIGLEPSSIIYEIPFEAK